MSHSLFRVHAHSRIANQQRCRSRGIDSSLDVVCRRDSSRDVMKTEKYRVADEDSVELSSIKRDTCKSRGIGKRQGRSPCGEARKLDKRDCSWSRRIHWEFFFGLNYSEQWKDHDKTRSATLSYLGLLTAALSHSLEPFRILHIVSVASIYVDLGSSRRLFF
jgi:hypothetical protein